MNTMTKQERIADLRKVFGQRRGVVNVNEVAEYMGVDRSTARRCYLKGLEYVSTGRTKWYDIGEVAGRLMEMRVGNGWEQSPTAKNRTSQ